MSKIDLIKSVAKKLDIAKAKAKDAIDAVFTAVKIGLRRDGTAQINGFGSFRVAKRAARNGRNPKTGERIAIPASKTVKFKPSYLLRDLVA